MSKTLEEVLEEAMALSEDERLELVDALRASVTPDPDYERAWSAEIDRRLEDFRSGRVQGIPMEDVLRELRSKFEP